MRNLLLGVLGAFFGLSAFAQESGWKPSVGDDKDSLSMAVTNASGTVFGQVCFISSRSCSYFVIADLACPSGGAPLPVLVTSAVGAFGADLTCDKGKVSVFLFPNQGLIDDAARAGGVLAIVMPLTSGQFAVERFNTAGASSAMNKLEQSVINLAKQKKGASSERL